MTIGSAEALGVVSVLLGGVTRSAGGIEGSEGFGEPLPDGGPLPPVISVPSAEAFGHIVHHEREVDWIHGTI